jgi:hypothetical protein
VRWKSSRLLDNDPKMARKCYKWRGDNFGPLTDLVLSAMHPFSRLCLESCVVIIRLKELLSGFKVISADVSLIESFTAREIGKIRENFVSIQTNEPGKACVVAVFYISAFDFGRDYQLFEAYSYGDYSNISQVQEKASSLNSRQTDLIKALNKD